MNMEIIEKILGHLHEPIVTIGIVAVTAIVIVFYIKRNNNSKNNTVNLTINGSNNFQAGRDIGKK